MQFLGGDSASHGNIINFLNRTSLTNLLKKQKTSKLSMSEQNRFFELRNVVELDFSLQVQILQAEMMA